MPSRRRRHTQTLPSAPPPKIRRAHNKNKPFDATAAIGTGSAFLVRAAYGLYYSTLPLPESSEEPDRPHKTTLMAAS